MFTFIFVIFVKLLFSVVGSPYASSKQKQTRTTPAGGLNITALEQAKNAVHAKLMALNSS